MKNKILLFIAGCFMVMLTSCLGTDDEIISSGRQRDAQIASFTLTNDSVPGLNRVKFTIDQLNGLIFNMDSMPYGTEIEKVLCNITFSSYAVGVALTPDAAPDSTIYWTETDSVDFSKPVKVVVTAADLQTTKQYIAKVNIHQVQPDSMVWEHYADNIIPETIDEQKVITHPYGEVETYFMYAKTSEGYKLYQAPTADASQWESLPLEGLADDNMLITQITRLGDNLYIPSAGGDLYQSPDGIHWSLVPDAPVIKALLGALGEGRNQQPVIAAIVDDGGTLRFAGMDEQAVWTTGGEVPNEFPIANFANTQYVNMYHAYLMLVGGRNQNNQVTGTTWATMNGTEWTVLDGVNKYPPIEGAMLTQYDDKFFLVGGINAQGKASKEIYCSFDNGINWWLQDSMVTFPDTYTARGYASVLTDDNDYMLIFSGKTSSDAKQLKEVWRGRINRLGF